MTTDTELDKELITVWDTVDSYLENDYPLQRMIEGLRHIADELARR